MTSGRSERSVESVGDIKAVLGSPPRKPQGRRLNAILDEAGFDRFAEAQCQAFYAPVMGRPGLPPGRYFRLLLLGYFEGLDSERGIAWRAADSLAIRSFVGLGLEAAAPDHSTISRTRRLIDLETHRAVFTWVQERLVAAGLLKGRTVAIDATTLEANAAMRSIVRRDTGESYQEFLTRLAKASGIKTPTREALARLDRRRKKRTSNKDWENPSDPGREDHEDEGWADAPGPQGGARGRSGHRGARRGDAAGRGRGRHHESHRDRDHGGGTGGRGVGPERRWPSSSPIAAYSTSKASLRYVKKSSPVLKPCSPPNFMSLLSSVYGMTRCGVPSTSTQYGRSSL